MSNTNNNNMQPQTSNALHDAIMKAGGKHHPLMLAPDKMEMKETALQSYFTSLLDDLKYFGRVATFKRTFSQDMDLLEKHLTKEILHEIDCQALDADLVVTESSEIKSKVQDTSNKLGNDTDTDDADIRPIYDEEPMTELQLTIELVYQKRTVESGLLVSTVRRSDFESWQQRIRLYCLGKENWENILQSIHEGPFKMGKFRETLVKGSELTKEERESQLYDDFEHFRQNKGETIHEYYVRFTKLINDMRNIKMTMPKMQVNSKLLNNMFPGEGPFKMGKFRETLVKGTEGVLYQGPKRDRVVADLTPEEKERYKADIRETNILLQGSELTKEERESQLYDDFEHFRQNKGETIHEYYVRVVVQNVQSRQNRGPGNNAMGAITARNGRFYNRVGNANPCQAKPIKCYNCGQTNTFDDDVDEAPIQDLALK
nr:hypothetical protein [Tanacetum cinerariifolium]